MFLGTYYAVDELLIDVIHEAPISIGFGDYLTRTSIG